MEMGYPDAVTRWIDQFVTNRQASLSFDGNTEPMTLVTTGIPQGSPVSPIIFPLYLKPLLNILEREHPEARSPSYGSTVTVAPPYDRVPTRMQISSGVGNLSFGSWFEWNSKCKLLIAAEVSRSMLLTGSQVGAS